MDNKKAIESFYRLVNELYSINYSSLKVSQQMQNQIKAEDFKFSFPLQRKESWIDSKMHGIRDMRVKFFESYNEINTENQVQYNIIDSELDKSKTYLQYVYNELFGKQSSFDEIFDGFLCKAPELLEYVCLFEMQPCVTNNPDIKYLFDAYTEYISNLFYKTLTQSMKDLIEKLDNDFNTNGVPRFYRGELKSDNVITISSDKIQALRKKVEEVYREIRSIKTKKFSGKSYTQAMAMNKYEELDFFLKQLEIRLKCANTDFDNRLSDRIIEEVMDFLSNVKLDKKLEVSEIYVTKLEMNYIQYLRYMIDYSLSVLRDNSKQENKEKGDI